MNMAQSRQAGIPEETMTSSGSSRPEATDFFERMMVALHVGRMKDGGRLRPEHISFGKLNNVRMAIEIAREARTILGGNGITLDYPVIRHANNLESVRTYEGTDEVHTLILGQALTGVPAFR